LGGGGDAYYVYDASGERIRKVIEKGTVVEERIYLGGWEVYRKTISGNLNFERETLKISDDKKAIAQIETKTVQNGMDVLSHPAIRYQYDNHLGSACLELDQNAAIISYEEYHPFGTTSYRSGRTETEVSLKRYKYVGKERDEETGLYYYGARYYAGWICRFVSVDPLAGKFPSFSPYSYAGNNPLHYSDPTGMQSEDEVDQVHPPTKPETKWNYSQELTESWYPDRQDLSLYTSDEFTILKQDVSTHDNLHATDYYYLNEDNWKPFEPAKSTFKEDVEKFALYPILFSGGAVAGSILIESLVPLAVEGVKASVPYLAKGALVAAEEAGLAYEAAQGIVATYPKLTGVILEIAGAELSGVDPIPNPLSSAYSEAFKFALFSYSHRHELIKNGKEVLKNDFQFSNSKNTSNLQMMPADNTRFVKPTIPYEIEKLDKKSIR
jgi:RHS repeat-associated protein